MCIVDNFCDLCPPDDVNNILQNPCFATFNSRARRIKYGKCNWTQEMYKGVVSFLYVLFV